MLHSNNFQKTTITIDGKEFEMEYDLAKYDEKSLRAFGNIYTDPDDKENDSKIQQFTFFTINNEIAGYTPMNGKREFISAIATAVLGVTLPFSSLLD
jgi:hypothetical protein